MKSPPGSNPSNSQMQRGVPTASPSRPQMGHVGGSQSRQTTPSGRGASPRMESRGSTSGGGEPLGSSGNLGAFANGSGNAAPSPWDMAASGGGQYGLLPQRQMPGPTGSMSPGAGGDGPLNSSISSETGLAGSSRGMIGGPGQRRELTPGGSNSVNTGAARRDSTPGERSAAMGVVNRQRETTPGDRKTRELTPVGKAGGMRGAGMMGANVNAPMMGSLASSVGRPTSPGGGSAANEAQARQRQPGGAPVQQGAPAFNMQPNSQPFGSFGSGMSGQRNTPQAERPGLSNSQPPTAASTLGFQQGSAVQNLELEAKSRDLEAQNAELNKRLDEDGLKFLEALISLESQVEELTRQNKKLIDDREQMESGLLSQGSDGKLQATIMKLERERQDVLQQLDEFEREKEEDLRIERQASEQLRRQLAECDQQVRKSKVETEREREALIEMTANEGRESQARIEKLTKEKEVLNTELAKALARAEAAGATDETGQAEGGAMPSSSVSLTEANSQLRTVMSEREALRDEVTNKGGQILLLQSQLEIKDRKLRIADMENAMLKNELEVLRRNATGAPAGPTKA